MIEPFKPSDKKHEWTRQILRHYFEKRTYPNLDRIKAGTVIGDGSLGPYHHYIIVASGNSELMCFMGSADMLGTKGLAQMMKVFPARFVFGHVAGNAHRFAQLVVREDSIKATDAILRFPVPKQPPVNYSIKLKRNGA